MALTYDIASHKVREVEQREYDALITGLHNTKVELAQKEAQVRDLKSKLILARRGFDEDYSVLSDVKRMIRNGSKVDEYKNDAGKTVVSIPINKLPPRIHNGIVDHTLAQTMLESRGWVYSVPTDSIEYHGHIYEAFASVSTGEHIWII